MNTKCKLFFLSIICLSTVLSCEKDETEDNSSTLDELMEDTFISTTTPWISALKDSIQVGFNIQNSDGDMTTRFAYGEDIIFDLTVQALTVNWLYYGNDYAFFDPGENYLFHVFSDADEDFGSPVSMSEIGDLDGGYIGRTLRPHIFRSSWLGKFKPSYPLDYSAQLKSPIPPGRYRVEAPVHVYIDHKLVGGVEGPTRQRIEKGDSIYITCILHFEVE